MRINSIVGSTMGTECDAVERLRKPGRRLTLQRRAVLEVMRSRPGHVTLAEVCECLKLRYPTLAEATVYRNLRYLVEEGLVAQTDLGGGRHVFEYIPGRHHHHLVCLRCKRVIDLPDNLLDDLRQAVRDRYGFVPCMDHFALFGFCPDCQERQSIERRGL